MIDICSFHLQRKLRSDRIAEKEMKKKKDVTGSINITQKVKEKNRNNKSEVYNE